MLATVHREANVLPDRLRRIVTGLGRSPLPVVLPIHPRTRTVLAEQAIAVPPGITIIEPLGYLDFAALASQAAVIATDSGGLQKEAYWYGVPCVTMRPSTEWTDTVERRGERARRRRPRAHHGRHRRGRDAGRAARTLRRRPRL